MANLKDLRLRIGSVKNTRKITAAMSQIASARLRKAQQATLAARPYGERMQDVVSHLVAGIDPVERSAAHPLLEERPVQRTLLILLTADKGLCGAFNSNVNRAAEQWIATERRAGRQVRAVLVGNKAVSHMRSRREAFVAKYPAPTLATLVDLSKELAAKAIEAFQSDDPEERVDRVVLYYNHFASVLTQKVTEAQVIPFALEVSDASASTVRPTFQREPVFEPSREAILAHLLPVAIESRLQQAMFNSIAAEIASRRVAMDAATDNATEMIADLTLLYNRERQAAITKELVEIIGGAEALKG